MNFSRDAESYFLWDFDSDSGVRVENLGLGTLTPALKNLERKSRWHVMRAAISLQEPARLLQHLFYFIAHEIRAAIK